jgi:uncharacterized protein YkwD
MLIRLQYFLLVTIGMFILAVAAQPACAQYHFASSVTESTAMVYLSENEKEVLRLSNMVRTNGAAFSRDYLDKLLVGESDPELSELRNKLLNMPPLPPLQALTGLQKSAFMYARYLSKNKESKGRNLNKQPFYDRIHQYVPGASKVAENYAYGSSEPLLIVVQMLLGNDENDHTGRQNILDPDLKWVGVSVQADENQCFNTVINLAGETYTPINGNHAGKQFKSGNAYIDKCPPGVMIKRRTGLGKFLKKIF